jgi:K+-sensing histidine kinase KdpD
MWPRSRLAAYGTSVVLLLAVSALRWVVMPEWSLAHPYLLVYPAIILAGGYGGFGPGVLATLMAAFALAYLWMPPLYSLRIRDIQDATGVLVLVGVGFAISLLAEVWRRARDRAQSATKDTRASR